MPASPTRPPRPQRGGKTPPRGPTVGDILDALARAVQDGRETPGGLAAKVLALVAREGGR